MKSSKRKVEIEVPLLSDKSYRKRVYELDGSRKFKTAMEIGGYLESAHNTIELSLREIFGAGMFQSEIYDELQEIAKRLRVVQVEVMRTVVLNVDLQKTADIVVKTMKEKGKIK